MKLLMDLEMKIEIIGFFLNDFRWIFLNRYLSCNYVQIGTASSNYTVFGFCHDSPNSLDVVTFI